MASSIYRKTKFVFVNKQVLLSSFYLFLLHPFTAAVSNASLPTSSSNNLERWLDEDVRLPWPQLLTATSAL